MKKKNNNQHEPDCYEIARQIVLDFLYEKIFNFKTDMENCSNEREYKILEGTYRALNDLTLRFSMDEFRRNEIARSFMMTLLSRGDAFDVVTEKAFYLADEYLKASREQKPFGEL